MSSSASEVLYNLHAWYDTAVDQVGYLNQESISFYKAGDVANSMQLDEEIRRLLGDIRERGGQELPTGDWISRIEHCLMERQDSRLSQVDHLNDYLNPDDDDYDDSVSLWTRGDYGSPTRGGAEIDGSGPATLKPAPAIDDGPPADPLDAFSDSDNEDFFALAFTARDYSSPTVGGAKIHSVESVSSRQPSTAKAVSSEAASVQFVDGPGELAQPLQHQPPAKANPALGVPRTARSPRILEDSRSSSAAVKARPPASASPQAAEKDQTTTSLGIGNTPADGWFKDLANQTHQLVFGKKAKFKLHGDKRIKIAVLDSGLAFKGPDEYYNLTAIRQSIEYEDSKTFIDDGPWDEDDHGHGTAVASIIARTAPNARIYIARVSRYNKLTKEARPDKDAVAAAIMHAVDKWKVDIINMSFGWPGDDHPEVDNALEYAAKQVIENGVITKQRVLMFAATSNFGVGREQDIYWPSRSDLVISIDSADGLGNEAVETSSVQDNTGKLRFTAPGVNVACSYPLHKQPVGTRDGTLVRQTGASFACGVASGIAALALEFANQEPCSWFCQINDSLRRKRAMELLFLEMSKSKTLKRFTFLHPWKVFVGYDDDPSGGDADPHTGRWDRVYKIADMLDKEHRFDPSLKSSFFQEWQSRNRSSSSGQGSSFQIIQHTLPEFLPRRHHNEWL